jgi:hypothetical protein
MNRSSRCLFFNGCRADSSSSISSIGGSSGSLHYVDHSLTAAEVKTLSLRSVYVKQVNAQIAKRSGSTASTKEEDPEDVLDKDILVCVR